MRKPESTIRKYQLEEKKLMSDEHMTYMIFSTDNIMVLVNREIKVGISITIQE